MRLSERGHKRRKRAGRGAAEETITGIAFCCALRARAAVIAPPSHQGLSETGYVQGQNLTIEYRGAEGRANDDSPPRQSGCVAARYIISLGQPTKM